MEKGDCVVDFGGPTKVSYILNIDGMSRRDIFAAMAMQSVPIGVIAGSDGFENAPTLALENLAMVAVAAADALIAELAKESADAK